MERQIPAGGNPQEEFRMTNRDTLLHTPPGTRASPARTSAAAPLNVNSRGGIHRLSPGHRMWAKYQFPRDHPVFFLLAASFLCSTPVFHPGSPSEIVPTPYIYRDELPISLTYFWL